jgi:Tol biopolymer transport system component
LSGIFISYRRSDNPDATGRIYDRLVSEFGKAWVFKDVDSIPLGRDFRGHLNEVVGGCAVMLAIVGPHWTDARNGAGGRRLEDAEDFVRIELETALARDIPVVPVLVAHAAMPGTSDLPLSLASMVFRQSIEVRPDPDFHNDATRLVTALRGILDPTASGLEQAASRITSPAAATGTQRGRRLGWIVAAVLGIAAAVLAVPAIRYLHEMPPPETRTEISMPTQVDTNRDIALSPDGRQIVFVATMAGVSRLWLRALAATAAQPLPGTEDASRPFWSPDSRSIGFFTSRALKRIDLGGGEPLTLAPAVNGLGGSWNAEGVILFSRGAGQGLVRIAATGGAVTEVTHLEQNGIEQLIPVFLPDGRRFVYASIGAKTIGTYLGSLDGTAPVRLTATIGEMAFLPTGWLLIWSRSERLLFAQRLDADKAALVGAPVTLAEGRRGAVSASATGLVAYWMTAPTEAKRQLQWRSRTGAELGSIGEPDETYSAPRVSPDGRRVAVVRGDRGKEDIWLLEGEHASRVTFDAADNNDPVFSPDGKRIVFSSARTGAPGLYQKPADGAGDEELLLGLNTTNAASSWSADGRYLLYVYLDPKTSYDLWVLPMTGDRKPRAFLNSPSIEGAGEFSPDGMWVAYESNESTRTEVYIRPFVAPGAVGAAKSAHSGQWQVSTAGGTFPKWSPNGKELYFLNPQGEMMAATITFAGSALTPGTPAKLFESRVVGDAGPEYDVARDGRFLINAVLDTAPPKLSPIILIQNWNPAGKTP